jgi:hypothetical protein
MEIVDLIFKQLLASGPVGLLAAIGWALSGFMLWREFKKRDAINPDVADRDAIIKTREATLKEKDVEIAGLHKELLSQAQAAASDRISDLKELTGEYNDVVNDVNHTLEKLSISLHVKTSDQ